MRHAPLALLLAACDTIAPAPAPSAPRTTVARPPDAGARDLAPPSLVEVEVRGTVDAAGAPPGKLVVVLTDGPCFAIGSHYIGAMPAKPGRPYSLEVFPPRGTRLDVCAALVTGPERVTPWHGRADKAPLVAVGEGDVRFDGVDIRLARGEPVTVPSTLKIE